MQVSPIVAMRDLGIVQCAKYECRYDQVGGPGVSCAFQARVYLTDGKFGTLAEMALSHDGSRSKPNLSLCTAILCVVNDMWWRPTI